MNKSVIHPRKNGYLVLAPSPSYARVAIERLLILTVALLIAIKHWYWWETPLDTHWLVWHIYLLKWDYAHLLDPSKLIREHGKRVHFVTVTAERNYRFLVMIMALSDIATLGQHIDTILTGEQDTVAPKGELWVQLGILIAVAVITAARMVYLFTFEATNTHLNVLQQYIYNEPIQMKDTSRSLRRYRIDTNGKHSDIGNLAWK